MAGNSASSIEFLKLVLPEGPWALTSISTDRKSIKTQTFSSGQDKEARKFIDEYNGERNIYWHVNPPMQFITKKAEREDIKEVVQFHVDVDPRAGEDLEKEQARALKLLENPPEGIPRPTTVLFSGGGYQAFWKLKEPIPINGNLDLAEDAKLFNMKLEQVFGADNCHNIDRLCRLPGTINVPDAKKAAKGRKKELSTLTWHEEDRVYDLSEFKKAVQVQMASSAKTTGFTPTKGIVQVSGNIVRLGNLDELNQYNVKDRVKVIIAQGSDPENPKEGDNSRSAWLFDCLCQLARAAVPDDVIYSIITDPDYGISSSVLDKGRNAEKYALRQMERAKEYAIDPVLRELNDRYAVILNAGGKCRVVEEVLDPALGRTRLTRQTFDDFRNAYMNRRVQVGTTKDGIPLYKPMGKWWLEHEQRRQYSNIVFAPGHETTDSYNLWKGYACEPRPGDCSMFLQHIRENICNDNDEHYTYLIGWMANCVQHPDSPGYSAVVMRGKRGTGKSFFAKEFGSGLFGRHMLQISDPKHLVGSFNAHLRDCVILFGDEAFYAGDKKHESVLKMLITEEVIAVEAKGVDMEASPNFTHIILASNDTWVVPAGADERRFFVLDVADNRKEDHKFFADMKKQMNTGGREALLDYLLNYDLSNFEVRRVPKTSALHEQKLLSMNPEQEWWYNKLCDGRILNSDDGWNVDVLKDKLFDDYVNYMRAFNVFRRANRTALGKLLLSVCPEVKTFQRKIRQNIADHSGFFREVDRRPWFYTVGTLNQCRDHWDKTFGVQEWPKMDEIQGELAPQPDKAPF